MMDAPGQHFTVARCGDSVAGAVWLVEEGGLNLNLAVPSGPDIAARAAILWPSHWPRMAAAHWRRR